jgi:hypothetical protein
MKEKKVGGEKMKKKKGKNGKKKQIIRKCNNSQFEENTSKKTKKQRSTPHLVSNQTTNKKVNWLALTRKNNVLLLTFNDLRGIVNEETG